MLRRALKVVLALALLGAVIVFLAQGFPGLVGADRALTVSSGSMEPAIPTGSVVFVDHVEASEVDERIAEGDVITFVSGDKKLVTHRVVEKYTAETSVRFRTKGDNNDAMDPDPVYRQDVVGEVMFSVPFVGYIVAFANTGYGFMLLVWGPVIALVFSELLSLYRAGTASSETDPE